MTVISHGIDTAGKRTPIFPDGTKSPETGKNFMHENEFNRAVVKYLDAELKRCGFRTILVAPTDADTPLETRVAIANNAKADLYVSVHANANTAKWGTWGGTETYTYGLNGESHRIGKIIHKYLMQGTPLRDRGVKDGSHLYVVKYTTMPAVLVECAFMDNLEEAKLLLSDAFRKECAIEIAKGICEAYGVKYVSTSTEKVWDTNKGIGKGKVTKRVELRKNPTWDGGANIIRILEIGEEYYVYGETGGMYNLGASYANKTCIEFTPWNP